MMSATAAAMVSMEPREALRMYIPFAPKCRSSFLSSAPEALLTVSFCSR